jgi:TATA-binding protein-associated factor Taf7
MPYRFEREARTPYSEIFIIENETGADAGRVDLHFTPSVTYATLCIAEGMSEEDIQELIAQIDERLVMTTDPYREDLVVTVWTGRESGVYSDEDTDEEEELTLEEEDEEDTVRDGRQ